MDFPALAGNGRLKQQLSQREEGRGLSHAYLIAGPKGSGRHTLATELLRRHGLHRTGGTAPLP